ncbi:MAG: hypothetical protein PHD97_07275 [Bacteroidales bacterium]|nr:hypothetical protein [Bacteroidales bacterium]
MKKQTLKSEFHEERMNFKKFILENPNYYGQIKKSKTKGIKSASGNITFEELVSIGYNPETCQLDATIAIKLQSGFSGPLCQNGSFEYVRFFLDYGSGWEDQGYVAINLHDIPTKLDCLKHPEKPMHYVASLSIKPKAKFCSVHVLPKARAILSWEALPTENDPDYDMAWGNRIDGVVQIKNFPQFIHISKNAEINEALINKFLDTAINNPELKVNNIKEIVEAETNEKVDDILNVKQNKNIVELSDYYKKHNHAIEPLRLSLKEIDKCVKQNNIQYTASVIEKMSYLKIDWDKIISLFGKTKANVDYEELKNVGLDYNKDCFVATIEIKKTSGFMGDLCTKGSNEYVAFWVDWNNDCNWEYVGTTKVNVHDFSETSKNHLFYTALLPYDFTYHRKKCTNPNVVKVRGVLSWNVEPSKTNHDELKTYGNRIDTYVEIKPGFVPGEIYPAIIGLGGVPVDKINDITGLTTSDALFILNAHKVDSLGRSCPFAGTVVLQGVPFPGYKYRVQVKRVGDGSWSTLHDSLLLVGWDAITYKVKYTTITPDSNGYYDYQQFNVNIDNVLARWQTSGDEKWEVKLDILGIYGSAIKTIQLCNSRLLEAALNIDNGGNCKDFVVGSNIDCHFVARGKYFGSFALHYLGTMLPPAPDIYTETLPAPGNSFTFNTTGVPACGYSIGVSVWDRVICDSQSVGHSPIYSGTGLCLRKS